MKKWMQCFLLCFLFLSLSVPVKAAEMEKIESGNLINEGDVIEEPSSHSSLSLFSIKSDHEETLKNQLLNYNSVVDVTGYGFTTSNIQEEITALINRNPELFFINDTFQIRQDGSGNITAIRFSFRYDKETTETMLSQIEDEVDDFISSINWSSLTDAEKVLLVHDYVGCHCRYNGNSENSYNIYGALVDRKAVCQGYSQAEEYILRRLGVTAGIATSMDMCHAWVVVKVGDHWYHSDPTFDKNDNAVGGISHRYVLLSSETLYDRDGLSQRQDYTTTISEEEAFKNPTDTRFENLYWENTNSKIIYTNNKWYYTPTYTTKIIERNNNTEKTVYNTNQFVWNYFSNRNNMCLGLKDSSIYFAGVYGIYRFNPSTYQAGLVFSSDKEIQGIHVYHDLIEYQIAENEEIKTWNGKENTSSLDISKAVIQLSSDSIEYSQDTSKPTVTVTLNGEVLPTSAYSVSYSNEDKIGTATVTVTGLGEYFGHTSKNYEIVHTNHVYNDGVFTEEPTCIKGGTKLYTCTLCGATKTTRTLSLGHNPVLINAKEATETTDGYTGDTQCSRCGKILSTGTVIPRTGHDHHYDIEKIIKEPTCESSGIKEYQCSDAGCTSSYQVEIPAIGHQIIFENGKEATCESAGKHDDKVCSVCHKIIETGSEIPKLGHSYKLISSQKATCTQDGYEKQECERCKKIIIKTIPKTGHKTVIRDKKTATCEGPGYSGDTYCTICQKVLEKGKVTNPLGHNYGQEERVESTCRQQGHITYKCKHCGKKKETLLPLVSHQYKEVKTNHTTIKKGYKIITTTTWQECSSCHNRINKKSTNTIKVNKTGIKSLKYKKKKSTVKWNKVKNISGYQIQYSNKKNMSSPKSKKTKSTSFSVKGKWYFRVRAYKKISGKIYYSDWSSVKRVK